MTLIHSMLFEVLVPQIQAFIRIALILAPLSLLIVIFTLLQIQKNSPDKIRWR